MNTTKKQRTYSMKYCPELEDHVVVMTTAQGDIQNRICLSSHLCRAGAQASCGQENVFRAERSIKTEGNHYL